MVEKELILRNMNDLTTVRSRLGKMCLHYTRIKDEDKANYYKSLILQTNDFMKYFAKRMVGK